MRLPPVSLAKLFFWNTVVFYFVVEIKWSEIHLLIIYN